MKRILPVLLLTVVFNSLSAQYSSSVELKTGSYIINLGVSPQTLGNGLKPYGLLYQLLRNHKVPVYWVINPSKAKEGLDFSFDGINYSGSAFIVDKSFITPAIQSLITTWNGKGVVGAYTLHDTTMLPYEILTNWPRVVMDLENGSITADYYLKAEITQTDPDVYIIGTPASLSSCHDVYIMPHADPTWATHQNLHTFITANKGYLWAACHAVSVVEGLTNPAGTIKMNFLSSTSLKCYNSGDCAPAITESHAKTPTSPISFNASLGADPIAQYMGDLNAATTNGSEQWYIPMSTGSWNANTQKLVKTSDGITPSEGVKLIYGEAYNNSNNGLVAYMGGHDHSGSAASNVAAMRSFFNFIIKTGVDKKPNITISGIVYDSVSSGNTTTLQANVTTGTPTFTYLWEGTNGVVFSNPTGQTTNVTFPVLPPNSSTDCVVKVTVEDACGRRNFTFRKIVATSMAILPTNFSSFAAKLKNNKSVQLTWSVKQPSFLKKFTVERSNNGRDFEQIDSITVNEHQLQYNYSLSDLNPGVGNFFYRLVITGTNSQKEYSQVQSVSISSINVNVYPNPVKDLLTISNLAAEITSIRLLNTNGQTIYQQEIKAIPGQVLRLNMQNRAPGIYYIEVMTKARKEIIKVMH